MLLASHPSFEICGTDHLVTLAVSGVVAAAMILVARRGRWPRAVYAQNLALGILLLWTYPAKILARYHTGWGIDDVMFPMHLCDWAAIAGFAALVLNREIAREITWFWGIAGTLQGLLTPPIEVGFPHPSFFAFFQLHSGIVIAALYLVFGLKWRPRKGAAIRCFALGLVYLAAAGLVDWVTGANYGYLREKPEASLLDMMGPWPVYIFALGGIAMLMFLLLELPFLRRRRRESRQRE